MRSVKRRDVHLEKPDRQTWNEIGLKAAIVALPTTLNFTFLNESDEVRTKAKHRPNSAGTITLFGW